MIKNKWAPEIIEFLKENVDGRRNSELAEMINNKFGTSFTSVAINSYKTRNKIKDNKPRNYWSKIYTEEVIEFIKENYEGRDNIELAELVNKQFNYNLKPDSICMFKTNYKRRHGINMNTGINRGCLKKGNIPPNKGVKNWQKTLPKETQEKIQSTWFKKGHESANSVPIGTETVKDKNRKGGDYLYIKVANGKKQHNWKQKHRLIWEEHYGKIPDGYNVIFADGNRRNFDLDNLVLVSNAEELDLNFLHLRFDNAELTKTGLNIVKVHKKVLEKERKRK